MADYAVALTIKQMFARPVGRSWMDNIGAANRYHTFFGKYMFVW